MKISLFLKHAVFLAAGLTTAFSSEASSAQTCAEVFQIVSNETRINQDGLPRPVTQSQFLPAKSEEVFKRLSEVDLENPQRLSETLDRVAQKIGVSKAQLDEWINTFIDTGLVGGLDHASSLLMAGEKPDSFKRVRDMYAARRLDLSTSQMKILFTRYQGASELAREAKNQKAIAMAHHSLRDFTEKNRDELQVWTEAKDAKKEKALEPLIQNPKAKVILAVIYRTTLGDAMSATLRGSKGSPLSFISKGDRILTSMIGTGGFGLLAGVGGFASSLITGAEATQVVIGGIGIIIANALTENAGVYEGIKSASEKRTQKKFVKSISPLATRLLNRPEPEAASIQLKQLEEFKLTDDVKPLSTALQLEMYRDQFYETLTRVDEPVEVRSAVRRGLIVGKLAHDTSELILERLEQIQRKSDQVAHYLDGRQIAGTAIEKSKIGDVIQNIDDHAKSAALELKFANDSLGSVISAFKTFETVLLNSSEDESATLQKIRFFREHFESKLVEARSRSEHVLKRTRAQIDSLDHAYVFGENQLRPIKN